MRGTLDATDIRKVALKNLFIKKEESIEGLILSGSGNVLIDRQISQKSAHCFCIQFAGMSFAMEDDVPFDPIAIGFLSAQAEMCAYLC